LEYSHDFLGQLDAGGAVANHGAIVRNFRPQFPFIALAGADNASG
jgi:hypothetical protein